MNKKLNLFKTIIYYIKNYEEIDNFSQPLKFFILTFLMIIIACLMVFFGCLMIFLIYFYFKIFYQIIYQLFNIHNEKIIFIIGIIFHFIIIPIGYSIYNSLIRKEK
jgi:TRAP-type C4-dicarboxylate transport system permease small subunit